MTPQTSARPVWMELDLEALESNYAEILRRISPNKKIIASIKANAYGHGAVQVARTLSNLGVYALASASFSDAVGLRRAGIRTKILLFGGNLPEAAPDLLRHNLIPTVYNLPAARAVSEAASEPTPVYIKVDCGFTRLGVAIEDVEPFVERVADLPHIVVEGLYTHVPFADAAGRDWARKRLEAFDKLVDALAEAGLRFLVTQAMSSGCILAGLEDRCNAVCPGHLLYGLSPFAADLADTSRFRPVLCAIKTRLIHVAHHPIGLGGPLAVKGGTVTGVVPVGLYDGYRNPREGRIASMLIRGKRAKVIAVSLEYATLDLTGIDKPEIGEEIVVLGQDRSDRITLEEVAGWQATHPLDVLMSLNKRIPTPGFKGDHRTANPSTS